jgi:hypothetical protein
MAELSISLDVTGCRVPGTENRWRPVILWRRVAERGPRWFRRFRPGHTNLLLAEPKPRYLRLGSSTALLLGVSPQSVQMGAYHRANHLVRKRLSCGDLLTQHLLCYTHCANLPWSRGNECCLMSEQYSELHFSRFLSHLSF